MNSKFLGIVLTLNWRISGEKSMKLRDRNSDLSELRQSRKGSFSDPSPNGVVGNVNEGCEICAGQSILRRDFAIDSFAVKNEAALRWTLAHQELLLF